MHAINTQHAQAVHEAGEKKPRPLNPGRKDDRSFPLATGMSLRVPSPLDVNSVASKQEAPAMSGRAQLTEASLNAKPLKEPPRKRTLLPFAQKGRSPAEEYPDRGWLVAV